MIISWMTIVYSIHTKCNNNNLLWNPYDSLAIITLCYDITHNTKNKCKNNDCIHCWNWFSTALKSLHFPKYLSTSLYRRHRNMADNWLFASLLVWQVWVKVKYSALLTNTLWNNETQRPVFFSLHSALLFQTETTVCYDAYHIFLVTISQFQTNW